MIRLGHALLDAGHEVRFATVTLFREEIEAAGMEYVYLPPDWDQSGFAEAMRDLAAAKHGVEVLRMIYMESLPFIDEIFQNLEAQMGWADLMVSSYVFSPLKGIADRYGVPFATQVFAHNIIPSIYYPPEIIPALRGWPRFIQDAWNAMIWRFTDTLLVKTINGVVGKALQRAELPLASSFLHQPAELCLVSVSQVLFEHEKPMDPDRFKFAGYLRWQAEEDTELGEDLQAFTGGERVPVLTFGSVTFDKTRRVMTRFMRNWPLGKRIIVQSGWAGLMVERPRSEFKVLGKVSHDQLFKHASVVIHHGGSGTTGTVFHAGVPQIVIPHFGDQPFFANEVERTGCGISLKRRRWPENLASTVRKCERNKKMQRRAREVAESLAAENGPSRAVEILEAFHAKKEAEFSDQD